MQQFVLLQIFQYKACAIFGLSSAFKTPALKLMAFDQVPNARGMGKVCDLCFRDNKILARISLWHLLSNCKRACTVRRKVLVSDCLLCFLVFALSLACLCDLSASAPLLEDDAVQAVNRSKCCWFSNKAVVDVPSDVVPPDASTVLDMRLFCHGCFHFVWIFFVCLVLLCTLCLKSVFFWLRLCCSAGWFGFVCFVCFLFCLFCLSLLLWGSLILLVLLVAVCFDVFFCSLLLFV